MSHAQSDASEQVDSTREPAPAQAACREQVHELYLAGSGSFAVEVAEWAQDAGWTVAGLERMLRTGVRFALLEEVVLDYFPSTLWSR